MPQPLRSIRIVLWFVIRLFRAENVMQVLNFRIKCVYSKGYIDIRTKVVILYVRLEFVICTVR